MPTESKPTPGAVRAAKKLSIRCDSSVECGCPNLYVNDVAGLIDEETGLKELIEAGEMSRAWLKEFGMDERGAVLTTLEAALRRAKGDA